MIYLFTALYCEADPLIKQLHLKRVTEYTRFQQFASEDFHTLLTVSGVGEIAAAAAVAGVCAKYPPKQEDLLVNIGLCAGTAGQGELFLIHKLTEQATGKTFYPDILYRHPFLESALMTGMVPASEPVGCLYDMEAAAIYQAGEYYFGPHQMLFFKIISDRGAGGGLTEQTGRRLIEKQAAGICAYLHQLVQANDEIGAAESVLTIEQKKQIDQILCQLSADLHCTNTMRHLLEKYIRYAALAGIDYEAAVRQMYVSGRLPCSSKREGKQRFEELKQRLV